MPLVAPDARDQPRDQARSSRCVLATDVESYLPYDLLVKMDIATMAASLEARSPFLDHKVMEFAARAAARHKIRGLTLKYLLKKIGASFFPTATSGAARWALASPWASG